jgi:ATP-dependent Lhr-like helicase
LTTLHAPFQDRLPRTWPVFFARHGNLTRAQQEAIPPILDGQNCLLVAPTASGKTEAAIAPLLECHLFGTEYDLNHDPALRILYICPTRALVRDLYERLVRPLADLRVTLALKSGDTGPVPSRRPPAVLITTPESTDSLLTRAPRLVATLRAVVLDEIHLFDATPRGDHLRCLLKRIEHIRRYRAQELGQGAPAPLQRVALSATVPHPAEMAQRYLVEADQPESIAIIQVAGARRIAGRLHVMAGLDDLVSGLVLHMAGQTQMRKALVFCNTRNEVEQIAAYLREQLPFEAAVFVHYSNLDPALRREVEDGLAQASTAICVCTSTLELGIDIGSIDLVVLMGPPPTPSAFVQRIGRGGRRRGTAYVVGMARSRLEEVRFQALFQLAQRDAAQREQAAGELETHHPFCLSVLVQQVFSILKQSPTGGIRLADLRRVAPATVSDRTLQRLLVHLVSLDYLKPGRPGEWRAGPLLEELVDAHEIYSNIGADPLSFLVVDAYTGRALAQTERVRLQGDTLLMGGRLMQVVWRDRYRLGVRPLAQGVVDAELRFHTAPFAVPLEVSQAVAALLGFAGGEMALLQTEYGNWLFHFWGDIYGELLARVLQAHFAPDDETFLARRDNEHAIRLPDGVDRLPAWNERLVRQELQILIPRLEPFLELGRFHSLLPPEVAVQTVVEQVDLPRFERLYRSAAIIRPRAGRRERLLQLLR